MTLTDASFKADAIDHLAKPPSPSPADRRGRRFALIAAAALHLLIPTAVLVFALLAPRPAPPVQEIPVEVVVEKPPPKPAEEKPKPPPQPEDERPANDAPSAATQEKANRDSPDAKTTAPQSKPAPSEKLGAPAEAKAPAAAQEQKAEAAPTHTQTPPDSQADMSAAPTSGEEQAEAAAPAPPTPPERPSPPPAPPAKAPPGAPPAEAEVLPEYKFAHAATESPIVGGNAETRYFTIVYGMIRARMRDPGKPSQPTHGGVIVFDLDETGNLLERKVVNSSGSPSLDMAVMNAIAEAAPYPAPPGWQPKALRLTYGR